jgi:integral membrane protein (TIGR00529 family)
MEFSPLTKILVVFAAILLLSRARVPLGLALILGGIGLEVWAGRTVSELGFDTVAALTRADLWLLCLITALLMEFQRALATPENSATLLAAARRLGGRYGRAASLMVLPAAVGLVPMPGGALFSAPLVAHTVREEDWSSDWKSAVNYWFRHVWEYWWPLYPVVIITIPIFHLETWQYLVAMFPFSLLAVASGYLFLVRPHLARLTDTAALEPAAGGAAVRLWLPMLLVLGGALLLPWPLAAGRPELALSTRKLLAMLAGLVLALAWIAFRQMRAGRLALFRDRLDRRTLSVLLSLAGVMMFESFLGTSGLLPQAAADLAGSGIPLPLLAGLLPLVAGLVTGNAVGFAGTSFPLIVGWIQAPGSGFSPMSTLALAFGFGYAGMMLSPIHLCFVLTRNYFAASYPRIYRRILPCVLALLLGSVVAFAVFGALDW